MNENDIVLVLNDMIGALTPKEEILERLDVELSPIFAKITTSSVGDLYEELIPLTQDLVTILSGLDSVYMDLKQKELRISALKVEFVNSDEIKELHKGVGAKIDRHWDSISIETRSYLNELLTRYRYLAGVIESSLLVLRRVDSMKHKKVDG